MEVDTNTSPTQEVLRIKQTSVDQTELQVATFITKLTTSEKVSRQSHARQVGPDVNPLQGASIDFEALSENSEHSFAVNSLCPSETPRAGIKFGASEITMQVDTGASTTIIDEAHFARLIPKFLLVKSRTPVFCFSSSTLLDILGEFASTLILGARKTSSSVSVVRGGCGCLLSCFDCVKFDLVSLNQGKLVRSVTPEKSISPEKFAFREALFNEFPAVFSDKIGKLKDFQAKLSINPKVNPVRQKYRHVPHHLKAYVIEKLKKMISDGILEPVTVPMPWVSLMLALHKPGHDGKAVTDLSQIRIVAYSTILNTAIIREHRAILTPEELALEANGSDVTVASTLTKAIVKLRWKRNHALLPWSVPC